VEISGRAQGTEAAVGVFKAIGVFPLTARALDTGTLLGQLPTRHIYGLTDSLTNGTPQDAVLQPSPSSGTSTKIFTFHADETSLRVHKEKEIEAQPTFSLVRHIKTNLQWHWGKVKRRRIKLRGRNHTQPTT
jgi:hypothetical protein